ncbi:MAG: hypothetical protein ACRD0Y_00450 [Terriglobales bacterium]
MLLSESELRAALEPLLDRLLADRLRLFQLQFEPRVQAQIAAALQPQSVLELQDALQRLHRGRTAPQVFAALFDAAAALVGSQRALVVVRGEHAAVWRSEGMALPPRFPAAQFELVTSVPVTVRGKVVGYFCWRGAALAAPVAARLDLMVQFAGLMLLELALPARPLRDAEAVGSAPEPARRQEASTEAGRFAELLIEDLRLFLEMDRAEDLGKGIRTGDWPQRFGPEIDRCRQAYAARYEDEMKTFEGVVPRLVE